LNGYQIFRRKGIKVEPKNLKFLGNVSLDNSYSSALECNWGYVPYFWQQSQPSNSVKLKVNTEPYKEGYRTTLHFPTQIPNEEKDLLLEFEEVEPDSFTLSDSHGISNFTKTILFRSLSGRSTYYRVPVSSCPQWYDFRGDKLVIEHKRPQKLISARLVAPRT
jgi:hypothetical protein